MIVKKILIFFIIFFLASCSNNYLDQSKETAIIECPSVYFSSENNTYIDGDYKNLDLEKVNYKASLNNYSFIGDCKSEAQNNIFKLELLILTEPINPKNDLVNLPIFVLLYDKDNNLIDRQYFRFIDNLNSSSIKSDYEVTDIIGSLSIYMDQQKDVDYMTIGFVKLN